MIEYQHLINQPNWRLLHLENVASSQGDLENLRRIHTVMAHRLAFRTIPEPRATSGSTDNWNLSDR